MPSTLDALYNRATVSIWVEDVLTREYLIGVWGAGPIQFLIGGNKEGVVAAAGQAGRDVDVDRKIAALAQLPLPFLYLYGIADRDFEPTNKADWGVTTWTGRQYYLDTIEIENLLLDEDALAAAPENFGVRRAGIVQRRQPAEIYRQMHDEATRRLWWMACKQFLAEYNLLRKSPFPSDPGLSVVTSLATAESYVLGEPWFGATATALASQTGQPHVHAELARIGGTLQAALATASDWKTLFAGKEIFESVANYVTNGKASPVDLARSVGGIHAVRTPPQLVDLRASIRRRAGV